MTDIKANLEAIKKLQTVSHREIIYTKPKTEKLTISDRATKYLTEIRKISVEVIEQFQLGVTEKTGAIVIPIIDENGETVRVNFRHQNGEMLKIGNNTAKEFPEKNGKPILLGTHLAEPKNGALVITFGTYDALSVATAGIKNACSVPGGDFNTKWIDLQFDWLEQFKEIILWTDNTKDLMREAREEKQLWLQKIVTRLGNYKIKIVDSDAKDASDLLQKSGIDAVKDAVNSAQFIKQEGLVLLADSNTEMDFENTIPTKIPELDKHIAGLMPKRYTVLAGDMSSGKSSLSINLAKSVIESGKKVFYWGGEQDLEEIQYWANLMFAGRENIDLRTSERTGTEYSVVKNSVINLVKDKYRNDFYVYDRENFEGNSGEVCGVDTYFQMAELAIRRYGCEVLFLDNLTAIATNEEILTGADYFRVQAQVVMRVKQMAKFYGVHVVVCAHTRKSPAIKSGVSDRDNIEGLKRLLNLADIVLHVRRLKDDEKKEEYSGVDTIIEIQKNRITDTEWKKILLKFDRITKTFHELWSYEEALHETIIDWEESGLIPKGMLKKPELLLASEPKEIEKVEEKREFPTERDGLPRYDKMPPASKVGEQFYVGTELITVVDANTPW